MKIDYSLSSYIESTLLKPDVLESEIEKICDDARTYKFSAVCVPPIWVKKARKLIKKDSNIRIVTIAGFPSGYEHSETKITSIKKSIKDGADDIDFVIPISMIKEHNWEYVSKELKLIKKTINNNIIIKAIIECCYLTESELKKIVELAILNKIDYVKTSTGYGNYGARIEDIKKIKDFARNKIKIKASGGIKTRSFALELIEAGADKIGTSNAVNLVKL